VACSAYNTDNAAKTIFFALYALQHRGQESAGIATADESAFCIHRGMGLVSQIFTEEVMKTLPGRTGVGHTRYSTYGGSVLSNAQPFVLETDQGRIAVAHNGQLVHEKILRKRLLDAGTGLFTSTDSELIAQMLARDTAEHLSNVKLVYSSPSEEDGSSPVEDVPSRPRPLIEYEHGHRPSPLGRHGSLPPADEASASASASELRSPSPDAPPTIGWPTDPDAPEEAVVRAHDIGGVEDTKKSATTTIEAIASRSDPLVGRISSLVAQAEGAFAIVVLTRKAVYGTRDRFGFRPLCIGKRTNADKTCSYFLSSESCALGTLGASLVREVYPGEIVRIDDAGVHSWVALPMLQPHVRPALCVFEYIYFARPDSLIEGQLVHSVRQKLGAILASECPADADIVSGVPDSSIAAAIGFANSSGLPYTEVFCKNRYIGRTFIQPDQAMRQNSIQLKFNALTHNVRGKRLVLVDDSIVRGNTLRKLVPLLREAGALEVHIRISSPPLRHPCYMGVDIGSYDQLIAHSLSSIEEICKHIGADSLGYISHDGMMTAVREGIGFHHDSTPRRPAPRSKERRLSISSTGGESTSAHSALEAASDNWSMPTGHCSACFTGHYPIRLEW
jgi:amidophosphoribosyltransferase